MTIRDLPNQSKVAASPKTPPAPSRENAEGQSQGLSLDGLTLIGIVPEPVSPQTTFTYKGIALPQVEDPNSKLTGAQANALITRTYHQLDQEFSRYLGDPAVSNWLTMGKYASREAGVQIADLENAMNATHFKWSAIKRMCQSLCSWQRIQQCTKLFTSQLRYYVGRIFAPNDSRTLTESLNVPKLMDKDIHKLHDALVAGNKGVYTHISPAFDTFMKTEAAGQDGIAALEKAGYGKGKAKDPQGFILQAFQLYKEARGLRERLGGSDLSPYERMELTARRQALIGSANLLMVANEQWNIVQSPKVFGDPDVSRMTEAMEGTMTIVDAVDEYPLLPDGGNWTDFTTRMGLKEVPIGSKPNPISITSQNGKRHDYVPESSDKAEGTICDYFNENLLESNSRILIATAPAPIPGVKTPKN